MKKLILALVFSCALLLASLWLWGPTEPILAETSFGGLVLDKGGNILKIGLAKDDKYRLLASLDQISPEAVKAALIYEDRYFYEHFGINPWSLLRGAFSLAGGRRMGGSTITMQVARLRYSLATSHIWGKLRQIWLALALELRHSKEEILEAYFNLAPYGGNIEGIEAAARVYFHKSAANLTGLEAQALAVIPQNPVSRQPVNGRDFEKARQRLGAILGQPASPPLHVYGPSQLPFVAPHLALETLRAYPNQTTHLELEQSLQRLLERSLASFANRGKCLGMNNAAAMLLNCKDMSIAALAGSANYYSQSISGQIDGTLARRSPGSTLKPFIYALALDQGLIHPQTILPDTSRSFGGYDPENFDRGFRGPVPASEALRASRNLPAITLAEQLAQPGLYGFLRSAEVALKKDVDYYGLALVLGGAEVSMRELATLYAMLANQGLWQPLRLKKDEQRQAPKRLLSPEAAWLALKMLKQPQEARPVYYKTGTSNGLRDAWTAGIIGEYVLVVWVGNFDNRPNPYFVGAISALPLFEEIAQGLASLRPLAEYLPEPEALNLAKVEICAATGDIFRNQCASKTESWIIPGVSPVADSGILRPIWIDKSTGLRDCRPQPQTAEKIWHEFWPSDMLRLFAAAGINKEAPPEWLPECKQTAISAKRPRILLPKKNVTYNRRLGDANFHLPLQGAADNDAGLLHWYAGKEYLGSARPGEIIYWNAPPGKQEIMLVDDSGHSAKQECRIAAVE